MDEILRKKISVKNIVLTLALLTVMIAIIVKPSRYISSALEGLNVFALRVLPALFPFIFLTRILTNIGSAESIGSMLARPMRMLYHAPAISGYIMFMSLISGYPVGAKLIADYMDEGVLTRDDAMRIMSYTSVSGPLFVIGTVGTSMLGSPTHGYIILASTIIGAIFNGLVYRGKKVKQSEAKTMFRPLNTNNSLNTAINSSVETVLSIGGFIVIFYIIADVIVDIGIVNMITKLLEKACFPIGIDSMFYNGIVLSTIEMTKGISIIAGSSQIMAKIPIISGIIAFGGASIMLQSMCFLTPKKIKVSYYLKTKLTQCIITIIVSILLTHIFLT